MLTKLEGTEHTIEEVAEWLGLTPAELCEWIHCATHDFDAQEAAAIMGLETKELLRLLVKI